MMSLEVFENIIKQVSPLTQMVTFHLMGEPLVHPELKAFVEICEKYQTKIFFVTNGFLLKPEHFDLLTRPIFHQVNFSLHSFFDNYPNKSSDQYLKKIFDWTDQAFITNPKLYINYRLWNLTSNHGLTAANYEMLNAIETKYHVICPKEMNVSEQKSFHIKNRLYLHFDSEFEWPSLTKKVLGTKGSCYGLSSHFGVHADGTVVPCCLDKEADIPLGRVQDNTILNILNSDRSAKIKTGFKNQKLVEDLCQRCQYITRFN